MATLAQTSIRAIAGNVLLNVVCNRNLQRTFNAMAVLEANKTFMFSLGKFFDSVKDRASTAIKDRVQQILTNGPRIDSSDPQIV